MAGKSIDKKLNKAFAVVGKKLGYKFKLYRSVDYLNPIHDRNFVKTVTLAASVDPNFEKSEEYSFQLYNLYCDDVSVVPGDIFVSEELGKTYTLVQNEVITVPVGIDSSEWVTISRPSYSTTGGFSPKTEQIAEQIPAKILETKSHASSGNMTEKTPYKSGINLWDVWFYLDKDVKINDILLDSSGNRSTIQSIQKSDLGWKATCLSTKS